MAARQPHIVIIEDEPVTRGALASYLDSFGYRVSECESAARAERLLAQDEADLLIVDINLEGKDGLEITREQRAKYTIPDPAPPPVNPTSVIRASPGPLTTQPITDRLSEVVIWASLSSSVDTVLITSNPCRAQDGHEMIVTPRCRSPRDFRISKPTLTSSTGSADSETRMVSPMPIHNKLPKPIADLTVPETSPPASVMPRWIGASVASASC